ncbi:hypothetical protein EBR43_12220, partial [bacterium]|nr:hypothetical protein [bacterium]
RKEERKEHDNADKKLKEGLEIVEKQYQEQKKELDEKKKQEVKNVLEKYKDDPTGLAKKLSEVTGFKIIMPDE